MMKLRTWGAALLAAAVTTLVTPAHGATPAPANSPAPWPQVTVTGQVTDSSGAPIPEADVRLWGPGSYGSTQAFSILARTTASPTGTYSFDQVDKGAAYLVDAGHLYYEPRTNLGRQYVSDSLPTEMLTASDEVNHVAPIALPGDGVTMPVCHPVGDPVVEGAVRVHHRVTAPLRLSDTCYTGTRWLLDGVPVSEGPYDDYQFGPKPEQVGQSLSFHVRLFAPDDWDWYTPLDYDSNSVVVEPAEHTDPSPLLVSGTPRVGQTLEASVAYASAGPGEVAYAWRRDGEFPAAGPQGRSYTLTAADVGHRISVYAYPVGDGYGFDPWDKVSEETAAVAKTDPELQLQLGQSAAARRPAVIRVRAWRAGGALTGVVKVRDLTSGRLLATIRPHGDAAVRVRLPHFRVGVHRIVLRYAGDAATRHGTSSVLRVVAG